MVLSFKTNVHTNSVLSELFMIITIMIIIAAVLHALSAWMLQMNVTNGNVTHKCYKWQWTTDVSSKVSAKVRKRWMKLAGHSIWHKTVGWLSFMA